MTTSSRLSMGEMFALIGKTSAEDIAHLPFPGHVATDSRHVEPGGAFVALEGERTDGHRYIPQAVERGAGLVVVRRGKRPDEIATPCVELDDPELDLARLASLYLDRAQIEEVVAVTGSVGKTTTRAALQEVLSGRFRVHAAERSLNTRIGCTATILAMPLDTDLLLMEFGANKLGEIAELADLFPPTTVLITRVASVHLEGFGTIEGVLKGKMEIVGSRRLRRFLYGRDDPLLHTAASSLKAARPDVDVRSVGLSDADFHVLLPHFEMVRGTPVLIFKLHDRDGGATVVDANVWGEHMVLPLAFASAVGSLLGLPLGRCAEALRGFTSLPGRGRAFHLEDGRFLVDDAYNANPASMRASIETFASLQAEGKMLVLGEMRELGEGAVQYHRELGPLLDRFDDVVLVGDLWREALPDAPGRSFVRRWEDAMDLVERTDWRGLLVKGSLSVGLPNLVQALCEGAR